MLLAMTLILGLLYPAVMVGVGMALPHQANGSLIVEDGQVRGSALIGQDFSTDQRLFQSRPSAAGDGYDPLASGASNLGPTSPELAREIAQRRHNIAVTDGVSDVTKIPADALTASGSGLDPDISVAYAELQIPRVAAHTGLSEAELRQLVAAHTRGPAFGFIGQTRVNVVELNQDLTDKLETGAH